MKPFFSIIIPCCNVEPYIEECLLSILNQSFQDWECLITVEKSRDDTERIVRSFAEKDNRIHFFVRPRSGSASIGRNTGLDHAQGKYVIFVDGDDYILENSLERIAKKISSHPDADLYPCSILFHDTRTGKEEIRDNYRAEDPVEMTGRDAVLLFQYRGVPSFATWYNIIRRDFLDQNNLRFVPRLKYEDLEFSARAFCLAKRICPIHELYYFYRIRNNSVTNTKYGSGVLLLHHARRLNCFLEFYYDVYQKGTSDSIILTIWRQWFIKAVCFRWSSPRVIHLVPRKRRLCSLRHVFKNPNAFRFFTENASFFQRLKIFFVLLSVRHPIYGAWFADLFFMSFYKIAETRDFIKKSIKVEKTRG